MFCKGTLLRIASLVESLLATWSRFWVTNVTFHALELVDNRVASGHRPRRDRRLRTKRPSYPILEVYTQRRLFVVRERPIMHKKSCSHNSCC